MIWKCKLEINNADNPDVENNDFKLIEIRENTKTNIVEIEMCFNHDDCRIEIEMDEFKRLIRTWIK